MDVQRRLPDPLVTGGAGAGLGGGLGGDTIINNYYSTDDQSLRAQDAQQDAADGLQFAQDARQDADQDQNDIRDASDDTPDDFGSSDDGTYDV